MHSMIVSYPGVAHRGVETEKGFRPVQVVNMDNSLCIILPVTTANLIRL